MTRRRLLALGFVTAPILGVAVACSFPDVEFASGADSGANGGNEAGPGATADASPDVNIASRSDAAPVDLTRCQICDCDGDGYWRDAGCDAGGTPDANFKGFGDCDDSRVDYHPGQTDYFLEADPDADAGFDFNCSGTVERAISPMGECTKVVLSCSPDPTDERFRASRDCGQTGELVACKGGGLGPCAITSLSKSGTQACH